MTTFKSGDKMVLHAEVVVANYRGDSVYIRYADGSLGWAPSDTLTPPPAPKAEREAVAAPEDSEALRLARLEELRKRAAGPAPSPASEAKARTDGERAFAGFWAKKYSGSEGATPVLSAHTATWWEAAAQAVLDAQPKGGDASALLASIRKRADDGYALGGAGARAELTAIRSEVDSYLAAQPVAKVERETICWVVRAGHERRCGFYLERPVGRADWNALPGWAHRFTSFDDASRWVRFHPQPARVVPVTHTERVRP